MAMRRIAPVILFVLIGVAVLVPIVFVIAHAHTEAPAGIATRADTRKTHPATQPGQLLEISIPELGNFDFNPDAENPKLPQDVKALSGVTIKMHGYMIPLDQASHITKFALVPALPTDEHRSALIQQTIVVTCTPGKSVDYCPNEIIVQGKLTVDIMKDDGFIVGIFAVDATSVKPASK
jgi:hypothetical protein